MSKRNRMKKDDEDERRRGATKAKICGRGDLRLAIATTRIKQIHPQNTQAVMWIVSSSQRHAPTYCR